MPETIARLRENAGISIPEAAKRIWMDVASYYDLESIDDEWEFVVELSQLLELSGMLQIPLLEILGERGVSVPLSFPELASFIRQRIDSGVVAEEKIGWDLAEFWEEPMIAMEYPVCFLKIVGEDVGFDWKQPIAFYQSAEKSRSGDQSPRSAS